MLFGASTAPTKNKFGQIEREGFAVRQGSSKTLSPRVKGLLKLNTKEDIAEASVLP